MASDSFTTLVTVTSNTTEAQSIQPGRGTQVTVTSTFTVGTSYDSLATQVSVRSSFVATSPYLVTFRNRIRTHSFQLTPSGLLMMANGMDPMLRWDGITPQAYTAGLAAPTSAPTLAAGTSTTSNVSITGTYQAYVRYVDDQGNVSNFSPISQALTATAAQSIVYSNLPVPTDPKVRRRQILRNTNGQLTTFYVDIDTTDLYSLSLTSVQTDAQLSTGTAVPLLDANGRIFANTHDVPPAHKAALAHHLSRMFAAVEFDYTQGCAKTVFGSATVAGVGTEWTSSMAGRFFYVTGATQSYQVLSVDPVAQVLTLTANYQDNTDNFAVYAIRPAPAERRLVYYSEAGLPESWPPINALSLQEDNDEITGLMPMSSWLYILERHHIYRFTFQSDPATDGAIFQSSLRGCINNNCWVQVEETAYMLDDQGVHAFSGGAEGEPISTVVQELFRASDAPERINWMASQHFHACHFPQQEVIRWFVAMSGNRLPRHAIAYNYRQKRWWVEEYAVPIGASCTGLLAGQPQVFLGSDARRCLALWQGTLDGPNPATGTVRGTASSATLDTLTDTTASFPTSAVVNNPVSIVAGTGVGQQRIVRAVSGQTLKVTEPFAPQPDNTSVYQLGGVQWRFQTGWFRFALNEELQERRLAVVFQTSISPATFTMRIFLDFGGAPYVWQQDQASADYQGVAAANGSPDLVVDFTKSSGYAAQRLPGHKEYAIDGPRYISLQLSGVTNQDVQKVFAASIEGVQEQRI
jgi:hypothetical protein